MNTPVFQLIPKSVNLPLNYRAAQYGVGAAFGFVQALHRNNPLSLSWVDKIVSNSPAASGHNLEVELNNPAY